MRFKGLMEPLISNESFIEVLSNIDSRRVVEIEGLSGSSKSYFLNGIFEDAMLNNVSIEKLKYLLTKNRLNFDEKSTYAVVDIDNLEKTIQDFVNFIKDLNL